MNPRLPALLGLLLAATLTAPGAASAQEAAPTPAARAEVATDLGSWSVRSQGGGAWQVTWRSPSRLPLTSDRPSIVVDGVAGPTSLGADQRTLTTVVTSATRPDDLQVLLSGRRLDRPAATSGSGSSARATAPDLTSTFPLLDADPGVPGSTPITTSDYDLDPVKLPGMKEPIEMVGHVVEPAPGAITGTRPLVLFLHGRHSVCYRPGKPNASSDTWPCATPFQEIPSQLGYDQTQRLLASQGFVTVSIRVNGINAQDWALADGGANARAQIVQRHLDYWTTIAAEHHADMSQVVLVGHSRGGEGVDRAAMQIPLTAPYRIAGQVLIAPTDFASNSAPYIPTVTLLPYCDGDVSDLQGQKFIDSARDLFPDDTALRSSVLVLGANHNYFNSEWTPGDAVAPSFDDWGGPDTAACGAKSPGRLSAAQQRSVGATYVAGAVRLFTGEQQFLPLFDGSRVRVASIGSAQVLSSAIGGGREVRRPRLDTGLSLAQGAQTRFCKGVVESDDSRVAPCGRDIRTQVTPHWSSTWERVPARTFFEMTWTATGQRGGLVLSDPLDLTDRRLELRTLVDPRVGDAAFDVRLTDATGATALVTPEGGGVVPALPRGNAKIWGQSVLVDPPSSGLDLSRITGIDLVSRNESGHVWLADVSAAPSALAAVPATRAPLISFGSVTVREGDGPGPAQALIPFTVTGLSAPARVQIQMSGQERGSAQQFPLDLAPGQTSGTIPVRYQPDRRDDYAGAITQLSAWPLDGVMTDDWLGKAVVQDDDPAPRLSLRLARTRVAEGQSIVVRARLSAPSDRFVYRSVRILRGPGPRLTGRDVPAAWRTQVGITQHLDWSLARLAPYLGLQFEPGQRTTQVVVPTAQDRRDEGTEHLTIEIAGPTRTWVRTVRVTDR